MAESKSESSGNKIMPPGEIPPGDDRAARRAAKKARKGPFVKYVGSASHRVIRPSQWGSLTIDLKDKGATHEWSVANDKMIEASQFSEDQLDYLLVDDLQQGSNAHAFLLVNYNSDGQLEQVTD